MADNVENLILQRLDLLRNEVRDLRAEMRAEFKRVNERLNHLDAGVLALRRDGISTDEAAAQQRVEHERLAERVERIERRLELVEEPKE